MQFLKKYFANTILIIILLAAVSFGSLGQNKKSGEIGISLGGSYYLGELNKTPFVGTKLSAGAFYRHTFDTRYAIKGNFTYGTLSGDAENTVFVNPGIVSFKNRLFELSGTGEFNFIPYLPGNKKYIYTPYVFAGVATAFYLGGEKSFIYSIPFGMGVKYNLNDNFMLGAFIGMHKTIIKTHNDNLDYEYYPKPTAAEPIKQWSYDGNKDWYSVFGVSLSYKIKYSIKCPAFD